MTSITEAMPKDVRLFEASFNFSQGNDCNCPEDQCCGGTVAFENNGTDCYMVLKLERWALSDEPEIDEFAAFLKALMAWAHKLEKR